MENDQEPYATDALLTAGITTRSRASHRDHIAGGIPQMSKGNNAKESHNDRYEEAPLLSRDIDADSETLLGNPDDGDEPSATTWSGAKDFEGRPWWNRPSLYWLLPPFLLYTLAFGGIIVPKLNLILDLICRDVLASTAARDPTFHFMPVMLGTGDEQCRHIDEVQKRVARFTLLMGLIPGFLSAITSPRLGELSDRYGRRKVMAFASMGALVAEITTIFAAKYPDKVSVNWILVGYAIDGFAGSFTAAMAVTYAYTSDCTAPSKRAVAFGYFHGCLFGGIAIGPLISGYIVKRTGNILIVFYISLVCHIIFCLVIGLVAPESLTKERQMQARQLRKIKLESDALGKGTSTDLRTRAADVLKTINIFGPLAILWPTGRGTNPWVRRNIALFAAIDTIMFGVAMGSMNVIMLYAEYMFDWGTPDTSVFVSACNVTRVLSLLVVLPTIVRVVRGPASKAVVTESGSDLLDLSIIRLSIAFDILGYIGYTVVRMGPLFIASGMLAALGGMGSPTISSAMTKHVPPERTGQLLGAMGLLHALARVVSPVIFSLIYSWTVGKFTQTVFVCLAVTWGSAFFLSWFLKPHVHWDEPHTTEDRADFEVERS